MEVGIAEINMLMEKANTHPYNKTLQSKMISLVAKRDGESETRFVRWTLASRREAQQVHLDDQNRVICIVAWQSPKESSSKFVTLTTQMRSWSREVF